MGRHMSPWNWIRLFQLHLHSLHELMLDVDWGPRVNIILCTKFWAQHRNIFLYVEIWTDSWLFSIGVLWMVDEELGSKRHWSSPAQAFLSAFWCRQSTDVTCTRASTSVEVEAAHHYDTCRNCQGFQFSKISCHCISTFISIRHTTYVPFVGMCIYWGSYFCNLLNISHLSVANGSFRYCHTIC